MLKRSLDGKPLPKSKPKQTDESLEKGKNRNRKPCQKVQLSGKRKKGCCPVHPQPSHKQTGAEAVDPPAALPAAVKAAAKSPCQKGLLCSQ